MKINKEAHLTGVKKLKGDLLHRPEKTTRQAYQKSPEKESKKPSKLLSELVNKYLENMKLEWSEKSASWKEAPGNFERTPVFL